jgi:hypothetical protein
MGAKSGAKERSFLVRRAVTLPCLYRSVGKIPPCMGGPFSRIQAHVKPAQVTVTLEVTVTWLIQPKADEAKRLVRFRFDS